MWLLSMNDCVLVGKFWYLCLPFAKIMINPQRKLQCDKTCRIWILLLLSWEKEKFTLKFSLYIFDVIIKNSLHIAGGSSQKMINLFCVLTTSIWKKASWSTLKNNIGPGDFGEYSVRKSSK